MTDDLTCLNRFVGIDDLIAQPFMISLSMIVSEILIDAPPQVPLAEQDHPVQALLLDRPSAPYEDIRLGSKGDGRYARSRD